LTLLQHKQLAVIGFFIPTC